MDTIRYIDLLASSGELRVNFEKAFTSIGAKVQCVMKAEHNADTIIVTDEREGTIDASTAITEIESESIPAFDFLLACFPDELNDIERQPETEVKLLFKEVKRIIHEKRPYGFMIENIEGLLGREEEEEPFRAMSHRLYEIIGLFEDSGYKLSWKLIDSQDADLPAAGKKMFIVGTLGTATVLSNLNEEYQDVTKKHSEFMQWLFTHGETEPATAIHSAVEEQKTDELSRMQKELLHILLEENRKKEAGEMVREEPPLSAPIPREPDEAEKEVYFKLYPPKKLVEITEEDGSVTGLVHSFIFQEVFEETVKELDFTRNLMSDFEVLFTSSGEQMLVIDEEGFIIRTSGSFFVDFWQLEKEEEIVGENIQTFVDHGVFQPNIFNLCKKKQDKVMAIQESGSCRIWSVATPVYEDGNLKRVVVLSKEIAQEQPVNNANPESEKNGEGPVALHVTKDKQLIYRSGKIEMIITQLVRAAKMNSTILIEGETGVGKEIFAQKVHQNSARQEQPFIRINCGAIPEKLIESELFGYEKGSFTGADKNGKVGYFELADTGTIFLDEIGELPFNMQVKLLRVLQEREITRIGGVKPIAIDVRIIAATNRNLKELVAQGEFREDLYYRLNVIPFKIPSLRERKEDIFPMAIHFLEEQKQLYKMEKSFTPEAIEVMETYDWPGNVRELQNIIERLLIFSDDEWIRREHVLHILYGSEETVQHDLVVLKLMPLKQAVKEVEKQLIELGMKKYNTAAELSEVLGISPATLSRRMNALKKE